MFAKLAQIRRPATELEEVAQTSVAVPTTPSCDTVEIALPSRAVARFAASLSGSVRDVGIDPAVQDSDRDNVSPTVLERLIASAIAETGGTGAPRVTRSPAGLYSPEYWRIVVTDANAAAVSVVRRAVRGESPTP